MCGIVGAGCTRNIVSVLIEGYVASNIAATIRARRRARRQRARRARTSRGSRISTKQVRESQLEGITGIAPYALGDARRAGHR